MHLHRSLPALGLVTLLAVACAPISQGDGLSQSAERHLTGGHGIDPANMDTTCRACSDFYRYANGGWHDRNPIPADRVHWSGYTEASQRTTDTLRAILEDAARQARRGAAGAVGRLGTFYATCTDSARAEADGISPIAGDLARIDALRAKTQLSAEFAVLRRLGVTVPFALSGIPDLMESTRIIGAVRPAGIVLGDRGYYVREDSASRALLERYQAHVKRMLRLSGWAEERAALGAAAVLRLEIAFARAMLTREQVREPRAIYHPSTLEEARALAPQIDWAAYMAGIGAPPLAQINLTQPEYIRVVGRLMDSEPLEAWRALLRWRLVNDAAAYLSSELSQADWTFSASLSGAGERSPLWRRCIARTNNALGPELGLIYAQRTFSPDVRERARIMVENLRAAMIERIQALEWMSDGTREQALAKARALDVRLGYPDTIPDYSGVPIKEGPFLHNMRAAMAWEMARGLARIGGLVDRSDWQGLPQETSGWYIASLHQLTYPAGKFQPPFFDPLADDAVNYGALGSTIAHEIVHGFDDKGRLYDAAGNLRDWWTAEDDARFRTLAAALERQYGAYTVLDTVRVNGRLTLGENIADLGGVAVSFHAFQRSQQVKPRVIIDGFTPEQRFFISWAQNWRENTRDESLLQWVRVDEHAPARWRVIGPLSNLPEFAAAFGCKPGDPMVRPDSVRVRIW